MAKLTTKEIRNVALVGHSSAGKTSLAEAMLYLTKATDRLGNPILRRIGLPFFFSVCR